MRIGTLGTRPPGKKRCSQTVGGGTGLQGPPRTDQPRPRALLRSLRLLHAPQFSARGSTWPPQLQNFFTRGFPTEDGCLCLRGPGAVLGARDPAWAPGSSQRGRPAGRPGSQDAAAAAGFLSNMWGLFGFVCLVFQVLFVNLHFKMYVFTSNCKLWHRLLFLTVCALW